MNHQIHNEIVSFIWGIADDVLRDHYVRGKYRDVILPMVVIRRLDLLLKPSKQKVIDFNKKMERLKVKSPKAAIEAFSGEAFYNTSEFTLQDLKNRSKQATLKADFENYLDGFSDNVQEILSKFKFRNQIDTLVEAEILGNLIEKFLDNRINLSPNPVRDEKGIIIKEGLDNHSMGTVFEELIRKFNEENNEEAGEHFTPRDVVTLMADLIFKPIAPEIGSGTFSIYDGACGTGGMLTEAENRLEEIVKQHDGTPNILLYGQEVNAETYAICKADLLLKGEGKQAENIKFGSTLSNDAFDGEHFDFMLSNPPYGKSWKTDLDRMGGKSEMKDKRFVISHADESEFSMLPRSSDGQLLFLVNKCTKMKRETKLGSRIAQVHNGSSLFTGDAGQGESNIRRWIIENDWLEAIIALPENMFYNTGIATYIWVLTNRKAPHRQGKVQLIDATSISTPLRKNLGKKNCQFSPEQIETLCTMHADFTKTAQSKIFPNEAFGYHKITVERPLRLKVDLTGPLSADFLKACAEAKEKELPALVEGVKERMGPGPHMDYNIFIAAVEAEAEARHIKLTTKARKCLQTDLAKQEEAAQPVRKKTKKAGGTKERPMYGQYHRDMEGKTMLVEYEPDSALRDTEQIPLLEEGGIEAFFKREVLPYVPDAWIDESKTQVGYEISFTRYFYKPEPMRTLEEIKADIYALEQETDGLLQQIVGAKEA